MILAVSMEVCVMGLIMESMLSSVQCEFKRHPYTVPHVGDVSRDGIGNELATVFERTQELEFVNDVQRFGVRIHPRSRGFYDDGAVNCPRLVRLATEFFFQLVNPRFEPFGLYTQLVRIPLECLAFAQHLAGNGSFVCNIFDFS